MSILMFSDSASAWPFMVAMLLYTNAGVKDLIRTLKTINKIVKKKKLRAQIMVRLAESLDFYSCLKR